MNKRRRYKAKAKRLLCKRGMEWYQKKKMELFFDSDALPEQLDVSRDLVWDKTDLSQLKDVQD